MWPTGQTGQKCERGDTMVVLNHSKQITVLHVFTIKSASVSEWRLS